MAHNRKVSSRAAHSIALLLHKEPDLNNSALALRLRQHPNWVRQWRKRWATEGFSLKDKKGRGRKPVFTPLERNIVKAIACEMPRQKNQPLSRYALSDLVGRVQQEPRIRTMSRTTLWSILHKDAIKPWQHRCWIFPRDEEVCREGKRGFGFV